MVRNHCLCEYRMEADILYVKLTGEIDHHRAVSVRGEIDDKICNLMPKKTVLDLSGIEFMDSSGLGLIMGRYALMEKLGGKLTLQNPNERIVRILKMAGFDKKIGREEKK